MLDTKTRDEKQCEHLEKVRQHSHEELMKLAEEDLSCSVHDAMAKVLKYGNCDDKACMIRLFTEYCFAEHLISLPK